MLSVRRNGRMGRVRKKEYKEVEEVQERSSERCDCCCARRWRTYGAGSFGLFPNPYGLGLCRAAGALG
jgi:hypothetical protein